MTLGLYALGFILAEIDSKNEVRNDNVREDKSDEDLYQMNQRQRLKTMSTCAPLRNPVPTTIKKVRRYVIIEAVP